MKQNAIEQNIIRDLSTSYELSLLIGNSTSIKENCENFLNVLMSRKNLSFAGYWTFNQKKEQTPELISAIPSSNFENIEPHISDELLDYVISNENMIIDKQNQFFSQLIPFVRSKEGQFIVYHIDEAGILIIYRKSIPFLVYEKKQLNKVIHKFGHYINNLIAQSKYSVQENALRKKFIEELSKTHNQYRFLFDNNFDAIFRYDNRRNEIIEFNEAFKKMFAWQDSIQSITKTDIMPEYQPDGKLSSDHMKEISQIIKIKSKYRFNFTHRRLNSNAFETETTILVNSKDKNVYTLIIKDLSDLKIKEAALAKSVVQLNKKNKELQTYIDSNIQLENFAFTASHDLQSPLRTVKAFNNLLHRSIEDNVTDDQKKYIKYINQSTNSMEKLINSLLNYSLVTSQKNVIETIDINKLLENVQINLNTTITEKKASIQIKNLMPQIKGDEARIQQLFQNLISNALKFTKPSEQPTVVIYCEDLSNCWKFHVQDNGIGIETVYLEKIFNLFNRLHSSSEFAGSGIGLATCKKIAEQHKGEIGVESTVGKGSTFYFTLSKQI